MKHLLEFTTQAAYNAAESGLITPNVSFITETRGVAFKPYVEPVVRDWVEIGGVKWATMNLGATATTDVGMYFQWGDTQGWYADQVGTGSGQKRFYQGSGNNHSDYKYCQTYVYYNKYITLPEWKEVDNKLVLDASDDAGQVIKGGGWRMPTPQEFLSLMNNARCELTSMDGIDGLKCTDKNDSSKVIFFPNGGYANNGEINYRYTGYWSNTVYDSETVSSLAVNDNTGRAYCLCFDDEWYYFPLEPGIDPDGGENTYQRTVGLPIRLVYDDNLQQ